MEMQSLNAETHIVVNEIESDDVELLPPVIDWYINKSWRSVRSTRRTSKANLVQSSSVESTTYDRLEALVVKTSQENEQRFSAMVVRMANETVLKVENKLDKVASELHTHIDDAKGSIINQAADNGNRRHYPAIWTLSYDQSSALVTTCELQLLSQLSGKCFQPERILIKVADAVFGKYGVAINTGLTLFACVVPDMLGKGVVNYVVGAAKNQVDRAVQVHSLIKGLGVSGSGSIAVDQHRGLSPDDTILLLRDLLLAYDQTFEPMKMSRISGLECAYSKTGEYVWAHRDEIKARTSELQICNDYPATTPVTPEPQQTTQTWPEPSGVDVDGLRPSALPVLTPPNEAVVAVIRSTVLMQICGAQKLRLARKFGPQSPYCKWTLASATGVELASGSTSPHDRGGRGADWSGVMFSLRNSEKAATLSGCVLLFTVKTGTVIPGVTATIAEGSFTFPGDQSPLSEASGGKTISVLLSSQGRHSGSLTVELQD